ncbi:MAG: endonuclease/exonuclease/phosphatase family protein [Candidatus Longimicrobiales bacterium M2_2A_002]
MKHGYAYGVLMASLFLGGCAINGPGPVDVPDSEGPEPVGSLEVAPVELPAIPVLGTDTTLDIGTWNLEWFGDPSNGPAPEPRQLENVWALLDATAVDVWAVQEVGRADQFEALLAQLAGYDGLLATDPRVADGRAHYSGFGGNELKVGLVYRSGSVTVDSARVILTDYDYEFAGRPPLKVHLRAGDGPSPTELVVIVLHAKAGDEPEDRDRRAAGSRALKGYLDARYPEARVVVAGDFNDDTDLSITTGEPSPYQNFVDVPGYAFPTAALTAAGASSTVFWPEIIDHELATDELMADYVAGSAAVVPADDWLAAYPESTSDHYPVVARYRPPGGAIASTTAGWVHVRLRWAGLEATEVDIYRDGELVVTGANDGAFLDSVPPGGSALAYRVCERGTDRCTPEAVLEP